MTDVERIAVPEKEWDKWRCSECEGTEYGQNFVNWIADRISHSTTDDPTGRFVLRELVQNADDVEAEIIVLRFCNDALYVYNNGFGFRSSVEGGPGDFERISRVLAKPKEKEFYTSGNFGSGFQTVYLFTNKPEVHSHGKSFRYDPTGPVKISLSQKEKIESPYKQDEVKKGTVFKFPWRTKENAVVEKNGQRFFEDELPWQRWDQKERRKLFEELKEYLHDSVLCCQHLKKIRIFWEDGNSREGYQAERDFTLQYIDYDGTLGKVTEGPGDGGDDLRIDDWTYEKFQEFRYFIGSDFVRDTPFDAPSICTIVEDDRGNMEVKAHYGESYEKNSMTSDEYFSFLSGCQAIKKSDIHILIPVFPWEERINGYKRKAWSYSVIPLPKESGNNFTLTAHLFPKQARTEFELHQEPAKKDWLELVLLNAAHLFLNSYERYIQIVQRMNEFDDATKQIMFLDYLPAPQLGDWINVSLDDTRAATIDEDIFGFVFSKEILLFKNVWYPLFDYNPIEKVDKPFSRIVYFPRTETERWLLEHMNLVTFSEAFLSHPRFKELKEFRDCLKETIEIEDEDFVRLYGGSSDPNIKEDEESFFKRHTKNNGAFAYGTPPIDRDFIDKLIHHCLINYSTDIKRTIPIIPNKFGELCCPKDLCKEPSGEYNVLRDLIPAASYPHPDFEEKVKKYIDQIEEPEKLLKGIGENKEFLQKSVELLKKCYNWLEQTERKLPDDFSEYPLILDDDGHILPTEDVLWVPIPHYDLIKNLLGSLDSKIHLVDKSIFRDFRKFICENLKVKMFGYADILATYKDRIEDKGLEKEDLQAAMVEGVLMGIIDKMWSPTDLDGLSFLPSNGVLHIPKNSCLGSVHDKEIDIFLGVIDDKVQNMIGSDQKYEDIARKLGIANLTTDFVGYVASRIDRYAEENKDEDGLCRLDDEHHRLISDCLDRLRKEPKFGIYQEILNKRILPVDYRGFVILSTPPRWDQKAGERRLEKYEKRWPWVRPEDEYLDEKAKLVWESMRFLHIHENFPDAESEIIKELEVERPIARNGNPRGLMIHFFVPRDDSETSLFFDEALQDFVEETLPKNDIDELKKRFLLYLKNYYQKTPHETERVSTKDKPCLYDSNGTWRLPTEFAFKIDEDLEVLGYHDLHSDFSEDNGWKKNILANMGVADRLEFDKLERAIKSLSKAPRSDKTDRSLIKIMMLGLKEGIGNGADWIKLSSIKWIPTRCGERKKPEHALFPTDNVVLIIGDCELSSLIDYGLLLKDNGGEWRSDIKSEDLNRIGLRDSPSFEELIVVWKHYQEEELEPPPNLFDALERELQK